MSHRLNSLRAALLGASVLTAAMTAQPARAQSAAIQFDQPAQPLASALRSYSAAADREIIFADRLVAGRMAPELKGPYTPDGALTALLEGTGLTVSRTASGVLLVQRADGPQSGSAAGDGAEVEALIVTAQKKEENIQDVPIAISAFTQESLDAQKIEGGFDLLKAIPNVTFSKNNFTGYNFSIRGVGTKAISATTDPGVAVSFNDTTLIVNRLFEQEYFDIERVEVLRGPQGTLYGRNATSGVINVHSARPALGKFEGDIKLETGNYNARRARGMINIPVGETLAVRVAGALTQRDGYGINEAADDPDATQDVQRDVDDRNLWSLRTTVGWEPIPEIRVNALWERFQEDDRRARTSKQLCHNDPAPQQIGSFDWDTGPQTVAYAFARPLLSQGCLAGSLYDEGAYGTPNGASLPFISGLFWGPMLGTTTFSQGGALGAGGNPYYSGPVAPFGPVETNPRCDLERDLPIVVPIDVCQPDPYRGLTQSPDLRAIYSLLEPKYQAKADIFELNIDWDWTDSLTFTSQTVFSTDKYYATQDYNRFTTAPIWTDTSQACDFANLFGNAIIACEDRELVPGLVIPGGRGTFADGFYADLQGGGVFDDPQLGPSRSLVAQDLSKAESEQFNQEFRLVSNFDHPLNFSLGANFTRFETLVDYYVFANALSLMSNYFPFNHALNQVEGLPFYRWCYQNTLTDNKINNPQWRPEAECVYVDPNPLESINGDGHNYFRSANPYELTSSGLFGEVYWQATETLKVTLGARMTWDQKIFTPVPSQLLLYDYRRFVAPGDGPSACTNPEYCKLAGTGADTGDGARGSVPNPKIVQEWREPTGRIIVDWKPDLAFTDETMVYGSISHGYKGGGANPPNIAPPAGFFNAVNSGVVSPPTFDPEYINAFEIGTKNTLLNGGLILNGAAFYYDYQGYQVSKIVDRSASNENFDARVWGVELEWIYSPARNLRFNGTLGYLNTKIANGERSIDLMNRTLDNTMSFTGANGVTYDRWLVLKPWITNSSNCIIPEAVVEQYLLDNDAGQLIGLCPGGGILGTGFSSEGGGVLLPNGDRYNPVIDAPNGGAGFFTDLSGNELPNAPHWTMSLGAQYRFPLPWGWDATARIDHYWQDKSFARVYNTEYDRLRSWQNTNISLWFEQPDWQVTAEVYVKNAFDETPITDAFLNSDDSGLTTNVFTLDPRLVGVSVRKQF